MMRGTGRLLAGVGMALLLGLLLLPGRAEARWDRFGVFVGVPPVIVGPGFYPPAYYPPPPVYYAPPPAYYAPPPVAYTPPSYVAPGTLLRCYAGAYVCPVDRPAPVGGACACPGNDGRLAPGRIGT